MKTAHPVASIEEVSAAETTQPLLLRGVEAASLLNLGRSKVYDMMKRGQLPVVRIGRAVRIPREALLTWIRSNTVQLAGTSIVG